MNYLSVCSGIEAASVAWEPLGWNPVGFSEIEPFPSAVLAHHWPDVPNLGDMTQHHEWTGPLRPRLIVGGTPCQAFSVAGLRKGLDDPRGNLTLVFLGILEQFRPEWVVWENVPGVLSDKTGAFGSFLGGLGELGYGFAYRVLDAQYFGVPQRRRRVFVVGYLGDWRRAAAVLFEPESLRGDPPPSREARKGIAPCLSARTRGGGGLGTDFEVDGGLIPETVGTLSGGTGGGCGHQYRQKGNEDCLIPEVYPTLDAQMNRKWGSNQWVNNGFAIMSSGQANAEIRTDGGAPSLTCLHEAPVVAFTSDGENADPLGASDARTYTNEGKGNFRLRNCVAFAENSRAELRLEGGDGQRTGALTSGGGKPGQGVPMLAASAVRRLTPIECERLQGFPDGHTLIPWRGKPADQCPDGPRYKALGNSMAVPVMAWIGRRIQSLEEP